MQCVILCGGLGTRMRQWTQGLPKAMIPVRGRPFLGYQLDLLTGQGVSDVLLLTGYRGEMIAEYVAAGAWSPRVVCLREGPDLAGTAGALRLALDRGALHPSFFLLYGDSYLPVSLAAVGTAFENAGAPALMTVYRNRGRWDASNALFQDGRVAVYDKPRRHPRSAEMSFIDYGLSVLRREVVAERVPPDRPADLADVFHALSLEGALAGFQARRRFFEIGSPAGLRDFERYVRRAGLDRRAACA